MPLKKGVGCFTRVSDDCSDSTHNAVPLSSVINGTAKKEVNFSGGEAARLQANL